MTIPLVAKGLANSSCLFEKLLRRNLIKTIYPDSHEYRDKLKCMLKTEQTVYAGFDATADSLHVGNLATIMNLLHFQQSGHRVICLIGDATTQIGDPSGHFDDRSKLEKDLIEENAKAIEKSLVNLFNNHSDYLKQINLNKPPRLIEPLIVRNSKWYKGQEVIDFVGDVFREVRVGSLLHKKSIQERLKTNGTGMNMSEFCYQIFQAYDWMELRKKHNCRLQIGGSDQAGNIYSGHDVIKRCLGKTDSIGLLSPLITDKDGKKLGKSCPTGNVWLNPKRTSPYQFYQFFLRTTDADIENFLKVYSLFDERTIEKLIFENLKKPDTAWHCQKKLAENVCQLVHGLDGLESAKRITNAFHQRDPIDIAKLNDEELDQLFDSNSIVRLVHQDGLRVLDLIRKANCVKSDYDAERLTSAGAVRLNGIRVDSMNAPVTGDLILGNGISVLRIGKRNYYLFRWIR